MVPLISRALCVALLVVGGAIGCAFQFLESAEYEESFSAVGYQTVEIVGVNGDLQLRGLPGTAWVEVHGTAQALGATRVRARSNLDQARLHARAGGAGTLLLAFDPPLEVAGLVDLELDGLSELPAELGLTLALDHGDITVSDLRGPIVLETADGDVTAAASGSIAIVAAGGADVSVDEVNGRRVDIETDAGPIRLALPDQDFEIFCYPDGGQVSVVEQGFGDLEVDQLNDGTVVVRNGSTTATDSKTVELRSNGQNIRIEQIVVE